MKKYLLLVLLIVVVGFSFTSCDGGGDSGNDGGELAGEQNCTDGIDNDGDTEIDCEDIDCILNPACMIEEPPPPPPPPVSNLSLCPSPGLNTDFNGETVFFQSDNGLVISALASDSNIFAIASVTLALDAIGWSGFVTGSNTGIVDIFAADINGDGDFLDIGETTSDTSGEANLVNNRNRLNVNDVIVDGSFIGDFPLGNCTQVDLTRQELMRDALDLKLDEMLNMDSKKQEVPFDVDVLFDFLGKLNE